MANDVDFVSAMNLANFPGLSNGDGGHDEDVFRQNCRYITVNELHDFLISAINLLLI